MNESEARQSERDRIAFWLEKMAKKELPQHDVLMHFLARKIRKDDLTIEKLTVQEDQSNA